MKLEKKFIADFTISCINEESFQTWLEFIEWMFQQSIATMIIFNNFQECQYQVSNDGKFLRTNSSSRKYYTKVVACGKILCKEVEEENIENEERRNWKNVIAALQDNDRVEICNVLPRNVYLSIVHGPPPFNEIMIKAIEHSNASVALDVSAKDGVMAGYWCLRDGNK